MKINDRYSLKKAWNSGGMGELSIYCDEHLDRDVVIKRLRQGEENRRIIDEQKALLRLRSKHVVQLFDIVSLNKEDAGEIGLVLEYVHGQELQLSGYTPDLNYLRVLWQLSCGLRDIHAAGMVHRDIKPNNILLDGEGVIKIIDFGLSRSFDCAVTRGAIGTPYFMAPELWRGGTIRFDSKVDVYAFGITALMLLNSDALFKFGPPPVNVTESQIEGVFSGLPSTVIDILSRCVQPDPLLRPEIREVQFLLEKNLLKDRHNALVVLGGGVHYLDKNNRKITLSVKGAGSVSIYYDGYDYKVAASAGSVYFNNMLATVGMVLPGCCVITFVALGGQRIFATFDASNPEVLS